MGRMVCKRMEEKGGYTLPMNFTPPTRLQVLSSKQDGFSPPDLEAVWVEESQKGDSGAFNQLVLQWEKSIYNLALRLLRHREEAAETTQEIFLAAFKNIRSFRAQARFSTWLYRIAINRCLSQLAHRSSHKHCSLDDEGSAGRISLQMPKTDSPEGEIQRQEDGKRAVRAMEGLPVEQRMVLELKFFQELTFTQIAEVLDMPESSVKTRLYAGLQALQSRLR